jgi:hypothetical protein
MANKIKMVEKTTKIKNLKKKWKYKTTWRGSLFYFINKKKGKENCRK